MAAGLLTGSFNSGDVQLGARLAGAELSQRDPDVAAEVSRVAADPGATPSRLAIARIRARSARTRPIIGGRGQSAS